VTLRGLVSSTPALVRFPLQLLYDMLKPGPLIGDQADKFQPKTAIMMPPDDGLADLERRFVIRYLDSQLNRCSGLHLSETTYAAAADGKVA